MKMLLRHRWFGDVFRYSGRFHLPPHPASRTGSQ
jgi:hypothetical protein